MSEATKKINTEAINAIFDDNRHIIMIYSAIQDEKYGHYIAKVPDGNGGKKEIKYTSINDPAKVKWPDKQIVWEGKYSEHEFSGRSPKAEERYQKLRRIRREMSLDI